MRTEPVFPDVSREFDALRSYLEEHGRPLLDDKMVKLLDTRQVQIDEKEMSILSVVTSGRRDRMGDILEPGGVQFDAYLKNPVVLWGHNPAEPVARNAWIKLSSDGEQILAKTIFTRKDELSKRVFTLYKEGILNAWSVGFIPLAWIPTEPEAEKKTKDDDEDGVIRRQPYGLHVKEWELIEYSAVSIPCNPDAVGLSIINAPELVKSFSIAVPALPTDHDDGIPDDAEGKPYPNEHACRLRDPDDFKPGSFKRVSREHEGKKYSIIMGRLKGETTMTEQAYRYSKDVWGKTEAQKHCKEHDGTFEAATEAGMECEECNMPEQPAIEKAGRVLSAANRNKVQAAVDALQVVLEADATSNKPDKTLDDTITKAEGEDEDDPVAELAAIGREMQEATEADSSPAGESTEPEIPAPAVEVSGEGRTLLPVSEADAARMVAEALEKALDRRLGLRRVR